MKYLALVAGLMGAVAIAAGCGGGDKPPPVVDSTGGKGGIIPGGGTHSGGKSTTPVGGDAEGGAGGAVAASGLTVTISSPSASSDPNKDDVLVTNKVTVTCAVDGSAAGLNVDPSSIVLDVLDAGGKAAMGMDGKPISAPGVPTGTPGEYSASFDVGSVATGVVSFRCSAKALQDPTTGTTTVSTFIDHGPNITVKQPVQDSPHALQGPMPVEFTVEPAPVADGDKGAAIADGSVTLQVAGADITDITEDAKNPGTWTGSVNFADKLLYPQQPPEHTSVHIEATNVRKPNGVTTIADYPIVVDSKGPDIAILTPRPNAAVHGETVVTFTASDTGAGLDIDTLYINVTGLSGAAKYDATDKGTWGKSGANTFSYRFDTAVLKNITSQMTVSIDANDTAGNPAATATQYLYKDDLPPTIDLDPGNARVVDDQGACSKAFDPLFGALNDLDQTALDLNLIRALVYDRANEALGQPVLYFAGVDPASVRLYAQVDPTKDFLVDTNNDGVCDSLAIANLPAKSVQSLKPVAPTSTLRYSQTDYATSPAVDAGGKDCKLLPDSGPLLPLCTSRISDMTTVVGHDIVTAVPEPVVFAMGSLDEPECTGSSWSFTTIPGADDWICFAVRAVDKLGNIGVSRPLRICYDSPTVAGKPACWDGGEPPPSCATSCTVPDGFPAHFYNY